MMDSIFLRSPLLIALISAGLIATIVSLVWRPAERSGMYLSFAIASGSLALALVWGASLSECAAVSLIFFLLNLMRILKKGGKKR